MDSKKATDSALPEANHPIHQPSILAHELLDGPRKESTAQGKIVADGVGQILKRHKRLG